MKVKYLIPILFIVFIFSLTACNTPKVLTETITTQTETIAPETTAIETTTTEEAPTAIQDNQKYSRTSLAVIGDVVEIDKVEQRTVNLSIFNGNGIEGNASRVSKILEVKYKILEIGNAAHFDYPETEIRLYTDEPYGGDARKAANDIKVMLMNETTISEPIIIRYPARNIKSDIIIVLGKDCK